MEVEGTVTEKPCGCGRLRCLRLARHKHLVWICLGTNRNCPWVLSSAGICKVLWSHICVRGTCVWVWEQENAMLRRCSPLHSTELRPPQVIMPPGTVLERGVLAMNYCKGIRERGMPGEGSCTDARAALVPLSAQTPTLPPL